MAMGNTSDTKVIRDRVDWIRNSLSIVRTGQQELHVLTTIYPESDALNPGGQLLQVSGLEEDSRSIVSTSRPLAAMWRSPRKQLWLGSSDGYLWTTAKVPFNENIEGVDLRDDQNWTWASASLPELEGADGRPNITAIWGTSDSNVFFATASGAIYLWNGNKLSLSLEGGGGSLTKIHGASSNDVYAVGYEATLLHWNGKHWRHIATNLDRDVTIITGVAVQKSGKAYFVTNQGQLLFRHRLGRRLTLLGSAETRFTGLVAWKGVLAASSTHGAWLYSKKRLRQIKDNFNATDIMVVQHELHFIESEQSMGPSVIEYKASRQKAPWQRIVFYMNNDR